MKGQQMGTFLLVGALALSGTVALVSSLQALPAWAGWTPAVVLLLAAGLELLKVDLFTYRESERSTVSLGVGATFMVMALYGVEAAVLTALLQALVTAVVNRSVWYKALFNSGMFPTVTWVAGWVYEYIVGRQPAWDVRAVHAAATAALVYFFLQSTCVTLAISLTSQRPFRRVWYDSFSWMMLQQCVTGMVGLLLGRFVQMGMTVFGVALLGSPLLLLRYSYKIFTDLAQEHVRQIEKANVELGNLNQELRTTNDELIRTLGSLLDARDRYTFGHSAQVATYSVALGQKLGLAGPRLERLRQAALLHDIGKVGIPEAILRKDGSLENHEWQIMKAHAELGYRIISQVHSLSRVAEIIRQHHEWFGGGGYPLNLQGDRIQMEARIISVADALDTLTSDRPYRRAKSVEVAFTEIRRCAGVQFDPRVVAALGDLIRERGGLWFEAAREGAEPGALAREVAASMGTLV